MASGDWYYVHDGERAGPVSAEEIARLLEGGTLSPRSLIWREGLEGWEQAGAHFDAPPPESGVRDIPHGGTRSIAADGAREPDAAQTGPDGLYIGAPARGFTEAIRVCLSNYFTFSGRASRSEYWYFILFGALMGIATGFLDSIFFGVSFASEDFGLLNSISSLVLLIPSFAVGWRRLHDIDRSGWWIAGMFILTFVFFALIGVAEAMPGVAEGLLLVGLVAGLGLAIWSIVVIVFLCTRGNPGPNRFG